jgi:hypothetical protein
MATDMSQYRTICKPEITTRNEKITKIQQEKIRDLTKTQQTQYTITKITVE